VQKEAIPAILALIQYAESSKGFLAHIVAPVGPQASPYRAHR
jgi:hypothetical protein